MVGRILSGRQAEELHKSIISYLAANDLPNAASALRDELNLGENVFDAVTARKYESLLEKKWTGVLRLRKRIMDLEAQVASLKNELETATPSHLAKRNQDPASWLPGKPARYTLESHQHEVSCVAFHPVYSSLASGDQGSVIKIWDWEQGELERTVKGHTKAVTGLDYGGPKGRVLLVSASSDLTIKLWDPADGYKNIRTLAGHDHTVSAVRFLPSGDFLVSASRDTTLRLWDVATGYCVRTLQGHLDWVRDVCVSPDGASLLSAGFDRTVRLWSLPAANAGPAKVAATMLGHENFVECCAVAPPSSYKHLAALAGLNKAPSPAAGAAFFASGARDKTVKLWDARGICIKTLVGHDNWVRALAFHPAGKYLLSVADDKTLRCWDLAQDGRCVKVLDELHDHFVSCLQWAPPLVKNKDGSAVTAAEVDATGTPRKGPAGGGGPALDVQIRCVVATASVDMSVKIFAG